MADLVEELLVADAPSWRAWLDVNESDSTGVWLVLAKKGTVDPTSLTYQQALEEALCSGWIDGRRQAVDTKVFRQHFTPRRVTSVWSQRNVDHVAELAAAGRMRPRGQEEIDKAKSDGRWERAYAGPAAAEVPGDLAAALQASVQAAERFQALSRSHRYGAIHRVVTARTPAARQSRITQIIASLGGSAEEESSAEESPDP